MAKKIKDTQNGDILSNTIVLRSVWGKTGLKYYIQPARDKSGRYPDCVRRVDSHGDIILSDADRQRDGVDIHFIPENETFIITDGKTYNLDDLYDRSEWEAIKNSILITEDRLAKDDDGNYVTGWSKSNLTNGYNTGIKKMGAAELYVDHPGMNAQIRVTKKKLQAQAFNLIINADYDKKLLVAKVFGRNMSNMPNADLEDYLLERADKKPEEIINIFNGGDLSYHALFISAVEHKTIRKSNGFYVFGEDGDTIIGATKDAALSWLKSPKNAKIVEQIRRDTFPEMYSDLEKK